MTIGRRYKRTLLELAVILFSIPILLPFYMLVVNSFKNKEESADIGLSLPTEWNITDNYKQLIDTGNILTGFKNSIILTVVPIVLVVLIVSLASFVLQRRTQRLSAMLYSFFILGMILPGFIVPTVMIAKTLHIPQYAGLLLVYATGLIPIGMFLYVGYFKSIPRDIDESAWMDGCGMLVFFYRIIFPLVSPVTATFMIISFLTIWNDFGTSLYFLSGKANQTLTLTMFYFFGPHSADWNLVFACIVISTLPVVVFYLLLQKYVVAGMTGGAVKG